MTGTVKIEGTVGTNKESVDVKLATEIKGVTKLEAASVAVTIFNGIMDGIIQDEGIFIGSIEKIIENRQKKNKGSGNLNNLADFDAETIN